MKTKIIIAVLVLIALAVIWGIMQSPKETLAEYPVDRISHAHGLAVDIANSERLYIPTHHGLLVLKKDSALYRIGNSQDDLMGFSIHPQNPKTFYRSGHPRFGGNSGLQMSEDGGFTWRTISNGLNGPVDFHAMTISPANTDLIYGWYRGNLQRSRDGGQTWEIANREILPLSLIPDPHEEKVLYAISNYALIKSVDQGTTWSPFSSLRGVTALTINPREPKTMLAFAESTGGLAITKDGGRNWSASPERFGSEIVIYFAIDPQNPKITYALTVENKLYKSSDEGATWHKIL